jgi:hypothetical protein
LTPASTSLPGLFKDLLAGMCFDRITSQYQGFNPLIIDNQSPNEYRKPRSPFYRRDVKAASCSIRGICRALA